MVRLTGGTYTSMMTQDKFRLMGKKGNQVNKYFYEAILNAILSVVSDSQR